MPGYRLCFLNKDNRIMTHIEHVCDDDLSALAKARTLATSFAVEIWQEERRVAIVEKGTAPRLDNDLRLL
ncbi:MAG TPA: hypothetical protein VG274_08085 [Rhizomicrobium sp.]|jgi:hypothetical protein|nr:hypothetical protein [Rhizomicrobium sp.]